MVDSDGQVPPSEDMSENESERYELLLRLNEKQALAVPLAVAGKHDSEIAAALGLTRCTVSRWRNHHPAFIAAVNAGRLALWRAADDRLRQLLGVSLDRVESEIRSESAAGGRLAWKVIDAILISGRFEHVPGGPTTASAALEELDVNDDDVFAAITVLASDGSS